MLAMATGLLETLGGGGATLATDGALAPLTVPLTLHGVSVVGTAAYHLANSGSIVYSTVDEGGGTNTDKSSPYDQPLPRNEGGEPKADPNATGPHTQLGTTPGRKGDYKQAREFDASGKPVKDIDFTDHGRPKTHEYNPHQHRYVENSTGGTRQRLKKSEPLD